MARIYDEAKTIENQKELKLAFAAAKEVVYVDHIFGFVTVLFPGGSSGHCLVNNKGETTQKEMTIEVMAALIGNNYRFLIGN